MICKDCEMEVSKLSKKGLCHSCTDRYNNAKYSGREYVQLKDIKGTAEYNKAMGRRLASLKKTQVTTKKRKTKTVEEKVVTPNTHSDTRDLYSECFIDVSSDVTKAFKENNVDDSYTSYNISDFLSTFSNMLDDNSFILQAKKGESIFNRLRTDYNHLLENLDNFDTDNILKSAYYTKILLELRRPTKEILDYYEVIEPIIDYLKKDDEFKSLLLNAKDLAIKKSEIHKNPTYFTRESTLIDNGSTIKSGIAPNIKSFICEVGCYNLYGNRHKQLFTSKPIRARNESVAKLNFKSFLANSFPNVTYKESEIVVTEIENKECL